MSRRISFGPDRRTLQQTYFHFSERPTGAAGRQNFSQHDTLVISLDKIYQNKFPEIAREVRSILIDILVSDVPLAHHNLTLLAAANVIVYQIRNNNYEWSPQTFDYFFRYIGPKLISDVTNKKVEDIQRITIEFKADLLRYTIFVMENTPDFSKPTLVVSETSTE